MAQKVQNKVLLEILFCSILSLCALLISDKKSGKFHALTSDKT